MHCFIIETPFRTLLRLIILKKSVEKIHIWLKSDKNSGYFKLWPTHIYDNISVNSSQNEKYFRQKLYRKSKHIFYAQRHFYDNSAVYEIMWINMVQPVMPETAILHGACAFHVG
jgi:hypothetical protein